jgi:uncharacterized membrane protein (DUF2068 family)
MNRRPRRVGYPIFSGGKVIAPVLGDVRIRTVVLACRPGVEPMFSSVPSLTPESEVSRSVPARVAPSPSWRLTVLRSIAAAHVLAGALEFLKVAGNLALKLPYTGGPLAVLGLASVVVARLLYALSQNSRPDSTVMEFWTLWIQHQAETTGSFLGAMVAVHIALGVLNVALGYGLWRRLNWARWLDVVVLGLADLFAMTHFAAFLWVLWVVGQWPPPVYLVVILPLVVPAPILAFLISSRTGQLFANRDDALPARRKRRWWTLSLQCVIGVLIAALALILMALFAVGPMAEVVWIAAGFTLFRP